MTIRLAAALVLLRMLGGTLPLNAQSEPVALSRQGNTIEVRIGSKMFTEYHFDPAIAKAYFQPLRSPEGVAVTRGYPIGDTVPAGHEHDSSIEPHQRDLYFGHGDINGYDFWSEEIFAKYYQGDPPSHFGRMVFRKILEMRGGSSSGTVRALFDLEGPDRKVFAEETQQFVLSGDKNTRVIDCEIVIQANHGPVKFGDTKEGTFALRLAPELDAPSGTMINSENATGEARIWGKRAAWVNVDGVVGGQAVGVALFDSPKSFHHPTYWHARGYGLLAANPFGLSFFFKDPHQNGSFTVPAGASIQFRYRVLIHNGDYQQAGVADQYAKWAATQQ